MASKSAGTPAWSHPSMTCSRGGSVRCSPRVGASHRCCCYPEMCYFWHGEGAEAMWVRRAETQEALPRRAAWWRGVLPCVEAGESREEEVTIMYLYGSRRGRQIPPRWPVLKLLNYK